MIRNNSAKNKLTTAGLFALAAATVVGGRPAQAQQTEIEALREQLQAMQSRLDSLEEAKIKTDEAVKSAPPVTAKTPISISTLLQVRGDIFASQRSDLPQNLRASDTFRIRRAEIKLSGNITPRVAANVMFDPARGTFGNASAASASASFGTSALQEVQLNYLLKKAKVGSKNNIFIDAGQFKIPLGYEGYLVSSSALQTIDRALIFTARDPFGGGYGDVRDTGIQLRGTIGEQFDFRLAAFNGLGERQNQLATSDTKALVARLSYSPTSVPGLMVGVSAAKGNTRGNSSFTRPRSDRNAFNLFGVYKKDKITFQTEYLTADSLGFREGVAVQNISDLKGYYASVGYLFTPKLEGVLRYDYLDSKSRTTSPYVDDTSVRDIVLGLNYYIKGNNAKIQANLVRRNGGLNASAPSTGNPTNNLRDNSTQLRVQGQVAF